MPSVLKQLYSAVWQRRQRERMMGPRLSDVAVQLAELYAKQFDESEHPRDDGGQFAEKDGGGATKKREPWEMSSREWTGEMDALRPNAQGTGGDTRGGMGRMTSEKSLGKHREMIEEEKKRLRMGLPVGWIRYRDDDTPYFSTEPPAKGEQDSYPFTPGHRQVVEAALKAGKKVPKEVLDEYPDLRQGD